MQNWVSGVLFKETEKYCWANDWLKEKIGKRSIMFAMITGKLELSIEEIIDSDKSVPSFGEKRKNKLIESINFYGNSSTTKSDVAFIKKIEDLICVGDFKLEPRDKEILEDLNNYLKK